jgi:hypothetical protein
MPSWKKVLVSGSSIEIAAVTSSATPTIGSIGSNYVMMIDPTTGYLTKITSGNFQASLGSYAYTASAVSGTPIVIGAADTLNISGSGGLTTTISTISGGARINVSANTGAGLTVASNTITVNSGSMLAFYTGSTFSTISGDILINGGGVATIQAGAVAISTDVSGLGVGVASALGFGVGSAGAFVVNGGALGTPSSGTLTNATGLPISTGVSGLGTGVATALGTNIGSAGSVIINGGALGTPSSGTLTNATGLPISGLVSSTSTALGVGSLELGNVSDTTLARVSAGVVSIEGNNIITANNFGSGIATFLATPSSANFASALTDETGTAGSVVFSASPTFTGTANFAAIGASGNLSVGGNAAILGDLLVQGTASFQNTQNLLVADKFILLASGSTTLNDGGIIVAYNTAGSGSALFLEAGTAGSTGTYGRFAVAYDVASGVSTQAADEFVVTAKTAASPPPGVPTWGGAGNGYGNIHVNSANGDIFIYS